MPIRVSLSIPNNMCIVVIMPKTICLVVDCQGFSTLLNGEVHVVNTTYQSRVNFTCDDGYRIVGAGSAVCLANGTWSNEIPQCIGEDEYISYVRTWIYCIYLVRDCGEFRTLVNGKVHVIDTTYQSRANFTCEDDYYLDGASSAVCLANGTWSDETPRCISKEMS